ncbi:class GN sortase [Pseudoalteromonas denitrificans]|uniref:Sortase A n=1 Tax=Pseudoalteromonas denitrificans DSM 6059 TaxID=1123010 RepID=A0A1I1L8Y1_9GAMM|nr:class GN sortase [Pseudoalteromonas denitrificans]SFC69557.1 sortase A [Pseudoalteromonas denitrificans DSM 6059]
MKQYFAVFLCCIGFWQLGSGLYMQMKAQLAQYLISQAWQKNILEGGSKQIQPWFYADTWPVAKLEVPSLGIEEYILSGASGRNLAFGAAHFLPSAKIHEINKNQTGKAGLIAGHNDTNFAFLSQLNIEDTFNITLHSGLKIQYQISNIRIIHQSDTAFLQPSEQMTSHLYLMTCYPFNALQAGTEQRYLVESIAI